MIVVKGLHSYFKTEDGLVKAVDDITFELRPNEVLALVGESGCGKSVTALTVMGLLNRKKTVLKGEILFREKRLLELSPEAYRQIRGDKIGMIFQEPMSAFDPLYTIGYQMQEVLKAHTTLSVEEQKQRAVHWLKNIGIPEAEKRFGQYPHEMSGGMLQRVMIAMALMLQPEVLIADEPTTALDVTIQAQVLGLIRNLQKNEGTSVLFITHDLGVVAEIADRVHVMYAGKIVEKGTVTRLFHRPLHPYTIGLLTSRVVKGKKGKELPFIPGYVPRAFELPEGCRFHPRCTLKLPRCERESPPEFLIDDENRVACWLFERGESA